MATSSSNIALQTLQGKVAFTSRYYIISVKLILKHYCNIMNAFTFIGILFIHSLVQLINSLVPACQSHGSRLIERLQEHFLQLHGSLQARCGKVLCMSEF